MVKMSEREKRNAQRAYTAATQGMVLLENNNNVLPIAQSGDIVLLGQGAVRTVRGGTGSGDPFNGGLSGGGKSDVDLSPRYNIHILDAFEKDGYNVLSAEMLREYAKGYDEIKNAKALDPLETFAYPEMELDESELQTLSEKCDTAIYVLARNAGEGADRQMTKKVKVGDREVEVGDYQLSSVEIENLKRVKKAFKKTILVLNVGGTVEILPAVDIGIDAILLMGQAGQEGGRAVRDVLNGKVTPSGKLTSTWAKKYSDYPTSATFAYNDGNVDLEKYEEGIYVGYRYFDNADIEPLYLFGYGLSYTNFDRNITSYSKKKDIITIDVSVKNIGKYSGKDVIQIYFGAPESEMGMPGEEFLTCKKTKELQPNEEEKLTISFSIRDMSSFDEKREAYILSKGKYYISVKKDSSDSCAGIIELFAHETIITEYVRIECPLNQKMKETITSSSEPLYSPCYFNEKDDILIKPDDIETIDNRSPYHDGATTTYTTDPNYKAILPYEKVEYVDKKDIKLMDVVNGKATLQELVAQLTPEQLADLNCGTGWGVSDENNPIVGGSSESVPGAAGETTHMLKESFGIPSMVVADGPGGIRVRQEFEATNINTGEKVQVGHYCTAWPVGTVLAQSFDVDLLEEVGRGFAEELEELGISIVLGPGIEIMRDPLCGRNFEYFSEDPRLAGALAAAKTKGIQSRLGIGACIKHYAANNQESNREKVDTWINQRALREIYLKPFEIAIKEAQPMTIMTSYNLINTIPTADDYDLCTDLARGEWGFKGLIMTDWNGGSSTPYKSMHAGNDLIMPGGEKRVANILQGLSEQKICLGDLQKCAINNLCVIMNSIAMKTLYPDIQLKTWGEVVENNA